MKSSSSSSEAPTIAPKAAAAPKVAAKAKAKVKCAAKKAAAKPKTGWDRMPYTFGKSNMVSIAIDTMHMSYS